MLTDTVQVNSHGITMRRRPVISTAIGVVLFTLVALSHGDENAENRVAVVNATVSQSPMLTALSQTSDDNRVSLRKIEVLTFKAGRLATRMRTTPPNQLNCISGCAGDLPTAVQCKNQGWDGTNVNWRCEGKLQRGRELENTRVRCEAYPEGDKEYILRGSCALDYSVSHGGGRSPNRNVIYPSSPSDSHRKNPLQYIVPLIMIAIVVVILCAVFKACSRSRESSGVVMGPPPGQPMGGGGFYGGGGGAGYPAQPGFNPGYAQPGYAAPVVAPQASGGGSSALGAGVGGFAAGAATGGLLGYMMGNRGGSDHHHHYSDGGHYGAYGGGGGNDDYSGGGGGYEMSTDFADTVME